MANPLARYEFRLAERLSMTRKNLHRSMTHRELYLWVSHDALEAADRKQAQDTANAKAKLRK